MHGLMMDYQLTIPAILRRTETLFPDVELVSRRPDRSIHRYSYGDCLRRAKRLALALQGLGVQRGDRVATFCWNGARHLEAYYGITGSGAVLHTLNLRLHPDELTYIASHAADSVVIVDKVLLPLFERFRAVVPSLKHVIVASDGGEPMPGTLDYDALLAAVSDAEVDAYDWPDLDERSACAMCYTSGTTGKPKGALYTHRSLALHSLCAAMGGAMGISEGDVILPVVPMFHANAWGLPFTCAIAGCGQVFTGPHLDPHSILELAQAERVTILAGVPTIWMGILQLLDQEPGRYDLSTVKHMIVGGAAVPEAMIRAYQERHGLTILQAWGMTETAPMATISGVPPRSAGAPDDLKYALRAMQGRPVPFVEIRARAEDGRLVPWDGETMGELEVRGAWVVSAYYESPESADRFTADGWFRTGDVATIDATGNVKIRDRAKDLIKSGGEWISSVAMENLLMAHPAVAEAAVIAVPHPKWSERPLACVVLKPGRLATPEELIRFLEPHFTKWALPDGVEFLPEIPRTSAGKFQKTALRDRFRDWTAGHATATAPTDSLGAPLAAERPLTA